MRVPRSISVLPSNQPLRGPEFAPPADMRVAESLKGLASSTMALGQMVYQQEQDKVRFASLQSLSAFQLEQQKAFEEAKRTNVPGSTSFYPTVQANYKKAESDFLKTIPPELQPEFSLRTSEFGGKLGLDAMQFQYSANDDYFRQGIQDLYDVSRVQVEQDPTKTNLETQRLKMIDAVASSGLSAAEKVAIQRKINAGLEGVAYKQAQLELLRGGAGDTDVAQAAAIIGNYGEMAPDIAEQQANVGAQAAIKAIGSLDKWAVLPQRIRAVLITAAAASGTLSEGIVSAAQEGDMDKLEKAVREQNGELADLVNNPGATLDNDPSFSNLPYEDRVSLADDAKRQVAAENNAAAAEATKQKNAVINSLFVGLANGTAGRQDIDTLKEQGILDDYDDQKKANDILAKYDEQANLAALGQKMLDGEVTFSPGDPDHKKILNAMIGPPGLEAIDKMDNEYLNNQLIPLVRKTGAVPEDVQNLVSGMIRSNDPDRAYWGLGLMTQLERASPQAGLLGFSDADKKLMDFWQSRKDYLTQDEMMKALRGPMDPAERNARKGLRDQGEKLFTEKTGSMHNFDPVGLFSTPGWFGIPKGAAAPGSVWVQEQLNNDFQNLFLDNYELYGDQEAAKQAATKQLQRVWGVTNVGDDNRLMKYPPEMVGYKPVRDSFDWMEAQLRSEGTITPNESFQLVSDSQTEAEVGKTQPSYLLVTKQDGQIKVKFGADGLPIRVFFDWTPVEAADEAQWRQEQKYNQSIEDNLAAFGRSINHQQETGTPIPDELLNLDNADAPDGSGGIANYLMQEQ